MKPHGLKPASPAEAIHIVRGVWAPAQARDIIVLYDSLTLGPCHSDPEVHSTLRSEYWSRRERDQADLSGRKPRKGSKALRDARASEILTSKQLIAALARFSESLPIVLWTSPNPGDRIAFWWMLDALDHGGIARTRCWVADSRYPQSDSTVVESLCAHTPEMIQDTFADISSLTPMQACTGVSLWTKYASPCLEALDQLRRSGTLEPADTSVIATLFFWGLPRVIDEDNSRLRLSELDQWLLEGLDDQNWVRPYDVLVRAIADSRASQILPCFGDRLFSHRLNEWACHQSHEPSLVSQPLSGGANTLTSIAYRLTPKGRRIVDIGLEDQEEAPEFHLGGHEAYRATPVWARHVMRREWQVKTWK